LWGKRGSPFNEIPAFAGMTGKGQYVSDILNYVKKFQVLGVLFRHVSPALILAELWRNINELDESEKEAAIFPECGR
jgi:hypothetical protein